ncbi:MAG: phytoene desaturase family protein [Parvibaculaceae bacterium]
MTAEPDYDVVVIGAGHNGLICGAYLARAGLKVCVVERRHIVGGACVTEELWPGYKVSTAAYNFTLLQPKIMLELDLLGAGLEIIKPPPLFEPFPDGRSIVLWEDRGRMAAELAKFSGNDARNYPLYLDHLESLAAIARRLMWETPPDTESRSLRDRWELLKFGWRNRDLLARSNDLQNLLLMSAQDYLGRWFNNDDVIAILGFYVSMSGSLVKLDTPGSAFSLIRLMIRDGTTAAGGWGVPRGGMGSVTQSILRSGSAAGMHTILADPVTEIVLDKGKAAGVALQSGQRLRSRIVVSSADLRTTFGRLVDPAVLSAAFLKGIEQFRSRGALYKINLALDTRPDFSAFDAPALGFDYPALVRIGPSTNYFAEAYDDAVRGQYSRNPIMVIQTTSAIDPAMAPENGHVVGILAGYAPAESETSQADVLASTLSSLETYAPGITKTVTHAQVLRPPDLEEIFALPGGHVHHGDMALDQIFMRRPVSGYARYRSPVEGLYLCGSSTHPGGGVTGVPGHNAAREILRDRRRGLWK